MFYYEIQLIINPKTLLLSGIATGLYAILTVLEAVGLWYEKARATILVLLLVGISIPPEIYELVQGVTVLKLAVFLANIAVLWYLLHRRSTLRELIILVIHRKLILLNKYQHLQSVGTLPFYL